MTFKTDIESRFWAFSLDCYARPGVRETCLDLQDRFGADVNVVLLGLWAGVNATALSCANLEAITAAGAGAWQADVVAPLRLARRNIKTSNAVRRDPEIDALREQLKRLELEAERQAQRLLAAAFAEQFATSDADDFGPDPTTSIIRRNVSSYLERIAPEQSADWAAGVETLVDACSD